MVVSSDCSFALTCSADHNIARYDLTADKGDELAGRVSKYRIKQAGNGGIALRSDGRVCAVGGWDGKIRLFSTKSFKSLGTLSYHTKSCQSVAFAHCEIYGRSDDGDHLDDEDDELTEEEKEERCRWLAAGGQDNRLTIWELVDFIWQVPPYHCWFTVDVDAHNGPVRRYLPSTSSIMARGGYTLHPHSREVSNVDVEEEMERAFKSDDEDQLDTTPLAQQYTHLRSTEAAPTESQDAPAYDFEREYDLPPPGSPSASALSSPAALGNSNGIVPSPSAILRREPGEPESRPSFFTRAVGVLLPQYYTRLPTSDLGAAATRARGSGIENDGVFTNVLAKPTGPRTVPTENGDIYIMPEDIQKDVPPSYAAAQADAVPPYWETTVHAPAFGGADNLLIDGLPSGTIFSFAWNVLISISFQFVGFMLTYLLHTTHAAKYGSRAGLGVTLIQYGLYSRNYGSDDFGDSDVEEVNMGSRALRLARRSFQSLSPRIWMSGSVSSVSAPADSSQSSYMHDWISFLLMTIGWFLLLSSILGFVRVKRWERSVHTPTPPPSREDFEHDGQVRQHLQEVFGFGLEGEALEGEQMQEDNPGQRNTGDEANDGGAELRRNLRAIGLI
ncbi:hypothetical protein EW145_g7538 [Phellinidium pouzarii]|uniref:Uncharacterized protein n=1 Tax=Phellinidium pouzarii TaxID=167371 RepID=A0A4S4KM95_9AGAM|nr:hypothetical protein EW145_g7538 [Phellinidium pouzarii]